MQIRYEDLTFGEQKTATTTTFKTTDSWDTVISYYEATLDPNKRDWQMLGRKNQPPGVISQYNRVVFQYNEEYDQPMATLTIVGGISGNLGFMEVTTRFAR